jgi:hypothetical protein
LQLSKCLADSDLVVIGLTGIGPIQKISVLDWFLPYWPNESFYIVLTDLITFVYDLYISNLLPKQKCTDKKKLVFFILHLFFIWKCIKNIFPLELNRMLNTLLLRLTSIVYYTCLHPRFTQNYRKRRVISVFLSRMCIPVFRPIYKYIFSTRE